MSHKTYKLYLNIHSTSLESVKCHIFPTDWARSQGSVLIHYVHQYTITNENEPLCAIYTTMHACPQNEAKPPLKAVFFLISVQTRYLL